MHAHSRDMRYDFPHFSRFVCPPWILHSVLCMSLTSYARKQFNSINFLAKSFSVLILNCRWQWYRIQCTNKVLVKETLAFLISIDFLKRFNPTGLNPTIATCFVIHTDPNPPLNITEENKAIITNESVSDNCYFHFFVIPLLFFRFNWKFLRPQKTTPDSQLSERDLSRYNCMQIQQLI